MLRKGINAWMFPGAFEDLVEPEDAIVLAKKFGYESLELCIGPAGSKLGFDASEAKCQKLVQLAKDEGILLETTASGLYWGKSLGDPDDSVRKEAKEELTQMLRVSGALGCKVHLTIPAAVDVFFNPDRPVQNYDDCLKYAVEGIQSLVPVAQETGVKMGIENVWNKMLTSIGEMHWFLKQIDSEWVGSYFDVGNALPFGYPDQWIRSLGSKIFAIHFKDFKKSVGTADGFVDLCEGDVDFDAVVSALNDIGFDGPVTAEMIPHYPRYPMVRVINTSTALDYILGRTS
jgi:hexulose-6-phosphate isomerase